MSEVPIVPISQLRAHGDLVFTAGQIGIGEDGAIPSSFAAQAELGLESLASVLEQCGASLADVIKTTVYVTDRSNFSKMNDIYGTHFSAPYPARTTIVTELALPELLFEIEAVAVKPVSD